MSINGITYKMYLENSNRITEANKCYQEATTKISPHFDKQIWRYQNNKKISANKAYDTEVFITGENDLQKG
jgi:hypothetical protein